MVLASRLIPCWRKWRCRLTNIREKRLVVQKHTQRESCRESMFNYSPRSICWCVPSAHLDSHIFITHHRYKSECCCIYWQISCFLISLSPLLHWMFWKTCESKKKSNKTHVSVQGFFLGSWLESHIASLHFLHCHRWLIQQEWYGYCL